MGADESCSAWATLETSEIRLSNDGVQAASAKKQSSHDK